MTNVKKMSKLALLLSLLFSSQACSPATHPVEGADVANAYQTSGLIQMKPYTRTIFSTTNW